MRPSFSSQTRQLLLLLLVFRKLTLLARLLRADGTGRPSYEFRFLFSFIYERKRIPTEQLEKVRAPLLCLRGGADGIVCPEAACEEWVRCVLPSLYLSLCLS